MSEKLIPANQDTEDDICVTLVVSGTTIGSWCITPTDACYKRGTGFASSPTPGTPSASAEEDEGSATLYCPWSALCRTRWSSATSQTGTRGGASWEEVLGYMCVCVPFGVWSCGSVSLAISLQLKIAPFTLYIRVLHGLHTISAVCSLALMPVHCSCKTDLTAHGLELLHLTRQLKLSQ